MKIKTDNLTVNTQPAESVHGAKPEPEERPVDRVMTSEVPMFLGGLGKMPEVMPAGAPMMKAEVSEATTVHAARNLVLTQCVQCKHFNNPRWVRNWNAWKSSTDPVHRASRDQFIKQLAEHDDPEAFIVRMGVCDAWTDIGVSQWGLTVEHAQLLVAPLDPCHPRYAPPMRNGDAIVADKLLFEARDALIERDRQQRSERLMQIANNAAKADRGR